ncbi:hypothetical protein [Streptomyces sp. NPDC001568]|uniref:hypothetical protein n=1 Tax=Streptomyces sp. NPDC001568 TaxID=3364588 RepID=UPI003697F463
MILEVTPDAPIHPKGVDNLQLGASHLRTYLRHQSFLTPAESHGPAYGPSPPAGAMSEPGDQ